MAFSRQEYWNGLPFPSPGDLPNPGIEPIEPWIGGRFFTTEPSGKPLRSYIIIIINNHFDARYSAKHFSDSTSFSPGTRVR